MKDAWSNRYEQLRHDALKSTRKSAGLVLLMRQGVLGWMTAWRNVVPGTPSGQVIPPLSPVSVRAELTEVVTVMAGMLMAGLVEASA